MTKIATVKQKRRKDGRRQCPHVSCAVSIFSSLTLILMFWNVNMFKQRLELLTAVGSMDEDAAKPKSLDDALSSLMTTSSKQGRNWNLWDKKSILFENDDDHHVCFWETFRPAFAESVEFPMCTHGEQRDRFVSGYIRKYGRWKDCDRLTPLLIQQQTSSNNPLLFVDIGSNIGACVLQVLTTTSATILAFEPDPHNLFCLTSTLNQMPQEFKNRVFVFPIALGDVSSTGTIHTAADNRGNAVIDQVVKDYKEQTFLKGSNIVIDRLDDILNDDFSISIHLLKMDAQGYECHVVNGMKNTLSKRVQNIVFEMEPHWLESFGNCSGQALYTAIGQAGLNHWYSYKSDGLVPLTGDLPRQMDNVFASRHIVEVEATMKT